MMLHEQTRYSRLFLVAQQAAKTLQGFPNVDCIAEDTSTSVSLLPLESQVTVSSFVEKAPERMKQREDADFCKLTAVQCF